MKVYIDRADWWVGYYRGPNHHYVCLLPAVVTRWPNARLRGACRRFHPGERHIPGFNHPSVNA